MVSVKEEILSIMASSSYRYSTIFREIYNFQFEMIDTIRVLFWRYTKNSYIKKIKKQTLNEAKRKKYRELGPCYLAAVTFYYLEPYGLNLNEGLSKLPKEINPKKVKKCFKEVKEYFKKER